jgi:hypothetical protein
MDRREFLQRVAFLGLAAGVGKFFTFPPELLAMAPENVAAPVLAKSSGTNYAHLVEMRSGPGRHENLSIPMRLWWLNRIWHLTGSGSGG